MRRTISRAFEQALACLPLAVLAVFLGTQTPAAAAQTAKPAPAPAHKTVHRRARPSAAHLLSPPPDATPAPVIPPEPPPPDWPANDKPTPATVTWDSQGLRIEAFNASLAQILNDFSTATGAKVDGMTKDERVFGDFGPGQARDVLSQLLLGAGYNVVMIGDQGLGAPRQIMLTARQNGDAPPNANNNQAAGNDEDADSEDQPVQPLPMRPGFNPGGPQRNPQQIMQEMQQRQQRQQQQQQNNPQ